MDLAGYTPGRFPSLEAFELPFVGASTGADNARAVHEFATTNVDSELRNVHLVCAWANDQGVIHSKRAIWRLEHMRGLKIRFPTQLSGEALRRLGANPVGMPAPQVPEALARGVIDAALLPWEVVPSLKVHESVNHHVEFPSTPTFQTSVHLLVMNKARYKMLPDDFRGVLDSNSGLGLAVDAGRCWDSAGQVARDKAWKSGNRVHSLSDEEIARWRDEMHPVVKTWVGNEASRCELLNKVQDQMKTPAGQRWPKCM